MSIDLKQFTALKNNSAKSFNEQKALIKKLMAGRAIDCPVCGNSLTLVLPATNKTPGIFCGKGCTDLMLDFEL